MRKIFAYFAHRRMLVNIIVLLIILGGIFSLTRLRQESMPSTDLDMMFISVSVFVYREGTVDSVIDVCRVTGASPPAVPAPATDTLTSVTPPPDAALTAGTTAPDTLVTGELHKLQT